ncbi:LPD1 domain-containing protein [Acidithiobacillus sp. IBUN Pt1247-S3]|uniref:LPD1 domain-containing protein n=1 Tax=Acidithiobacillus sp. IBUN Pt1247-S3 TaxID=3166642 RepID=UPI0034E5F56E
MAQWVDLSAHNLSFWRFGPDEEGKRRYLLLPIFPQVGVDPEWESQPFARKFRKDESFTQSGGIPGWILERDLATESLPGRREWLEAFPNALFRDRNSASFLPFVPDTAALFSLPLRSPWGFSPVDHPAEVYANEDQAAGESSDARAMLREGREIEERMVLPLFALSMSPRALQEDLEQQQEERQSAEKREDYGEYVPGSRKSAYEKWEENYNAILDTMGDDGRFQFSRETLEALAKETRRDLFLADWVEEKKTQPEYPATVRQMLRATLLETLPASVKTLPWDGRKSDRPAGVVLATRIDRYAHILKEIRKRVDALPENPDGDALFSALEGVSGTSVSRRLIPRTSWYDDVYHPLYEEDRDWLRNPDTGIISLFDANLSKHSMDGKFRALLGNTAWRRLPDENARETYLKTAKTRMEQHFPEFFEMEKAALEIRVKRPETEELLAEAKRRAEDIIDNLAEGVKNPWHCWRAPWDSWTLFPYKVSADAAEKYDWREKSRSIRVLQYQMMLDCCDIAGEVALARAAESPVQETSIPEVLPETGEAEAPGEEEGVSREPDFLRWKPGLRDLPKESDIQSYRSASSPTDRGDRDVSEAELCDTFGFRAVQYGNWMTQKDRQVHLNAAFDACADLQTLWDLPDARMVSLPRRIHDPLADVARQPLALALGARGKGRAAAHFESAQYVINMTKTKGAGAFLHEWTHAADAFLAAEDTPGSLLLSSEIAGSLLSRYTKTLEGNAASASLRESREGVMFDLRTGWEALREKIWKGLLGKDTASEWEYQIQNQIFTMNRDLPREKREEQAQRERRVFMEQAARWVSEKMAEVDQEIEKVQTREDASKVLETASRNFVKPFQYLKTNYKVHPSKDGEDLRWCETALSGGVEAPERGNLSSVDLSGESVSMTTRAAAAWAKAIQRNIWKSYTKEIFNNKDDLSLAIRPHHFQARDRQGTLFYQNASVLGEYWKRPQELIARAVAAFGYDRLQEAGITNTWLTKNAPGLYADTQKYRADSDPQGAERQNFRDVWEEKVMPELREHLSRAVQEMPVAFAEEEEPVAAKAAAEDALLS